MIIKWKTHPTSKVTRTKQNKKERRSQKRKKKKKREKVEILDGFLWSFMGTSIRSSDVMDACQHTVMNWMLIRNTESTGNHLFQWLPDDVVVFEFHPSEWISCLRHGMVIATASGGGHYEALTPPLPFSLSLRSFSLCTHPVHLNNEAKNIGGGRIRCFATRWEGN